MLPTEQTNVQTLLGSRDQLKLLTVASLLRLTQSAPRTAQPRPSESGLAIPFMIGQMVIIFVEDATFRSGMVALTSNPNTWEAEAGGWSI